ncbi:MAG TPA: hypothetical protein VEX38_09280 [Fimbriimonadaceae bacterium]|nr:hypothetical protein [Fimbriimonadaceae bacterium]
MKLNLLPTTVSRGAQVRNGLIVALLLVIAGLAGAAFLISSSQAAIQKQQDRITQAAPVASQAVKTSKEADETIKQAALVLMNINLANAMNAHNGKFPALYDEVRQYVPGFFRLTSMAATPSGAESTVVTMVGVISSYQQYADLMLALLRIPNATAVSRSGYQNIDPVVPALVPEDQVGRPIRPGEPRIPDDPLDRLDRMIANARLDSYLGVGNYGSIGGEVIQRGAMPGDSTITVAVVLARNMQTPDPRATLAGAAALGGGIVQTGNAPTPATTVPRANVPPPPSGGGSGDLDER